jgi:hypothetical protein
MNPDHQWQADVLVAGWSDDVEVQAVLSLLVADLITSVTNALLASCVSVVSSLKSVCGLTKA